MFVLINKLIDQINEQTYRISGESFKEANALSGMRTNEYYASLDIFVKVQESKRNGN